MFDYLKRLYDSGKLTAEQLQKAMTKNWITQEQYAEIVITPSNKDY